MTLDHSGALSRRIEMGVRLPFGVSGGARDPVLVRHRDGNLGRVLEISGLSAEDFDKAATAAGSRRPGDRFKAMSA